MCPTLDFTSPRLISITDLGSLFGGCSFVCCITGEENAGSLESGYGVTGYFFLSSTTPDSLTFVCDAMLVEENLSEPSLL